MKKVERNGKVAVLYSPGYSAGWSTLAKNDRKEALCMNARIVEPFLAGDWFGAVAAALAMFPDLCTAGAEDLQVLWVEKGKAFEIKVHDGNESVHVLDGNESVHVFDGRTYLVA